MRVLDLSQQLPGPYATYLLAALGAEVTKIEPPTGDAARSLDPEMFAIVNAGKTSIVLDLKTEPDRLRLYELVRVSDVLVEGFRPGVVTRLGCDSASLRAVRPELIYCSITGVGQTGPLAAHPTHDISLQAMAGSLPDADISTIGVPWVDLATASSAALAITAAWHAGSGCYLDMSMLDAAVAWSSAKPSAVGGHCEPTYGTVRTADGRRIVIALLEDSMWTRLCAALGWADWRDDPGLRRYSDRRMRGAEIRERLDRDIAGRTVAEVLELAVRHDLPVGPADAAFDPIAREQIDLRFEQVSRPRALPLPVRLTLPLTDAPELGAGPDWQDRRIDG